ncbi:endonuclease/exonuclease/phosphatase family protein [Ancylobacter sp. MQZ15Z-1]|uniref:Endonuclease/exonuclease/phosphatase family protein n=1 Tax=Ancylobacter mangrovi TaxID=2972472 RepID=A0A9X2T1M6_9HYPH|nr:endonuclease/exonuclease/phosphatase family protein [Ancylobacter mangrovi]MCS0494887.1 endonuclease/exonuclease/phosphatase family protein [Ancylobacter mangrovi]
MSVVRPPGTLRLMTWNIHGGIGPDRRFDLDRIAALVARHAPDILALQEIDTRGRGVDCLAPLRGLSIDHFAEARTIAVPDGHYGHALFSRWPTEEVRLHDLSVRLREPRLAIEAVLRTGRGPLHLVAVHLGLAIVERRRQAIKLAAMARHVAAMPTVMLGDFNDWFSFGEVSRAMRRVLPERTDLRTFPARRPTLRLDRVYCSRPGMLAAAFTDPQARRASDHLPIIADIRLPATASAPEPLPSPYVDPGGRDTTRREMGGASDDPQRADP